MYEYLMHEVVRDENMAAAVKAVIRNQGAPGIHHMKTTEVESHLQKQWSNIRAKLRAGKGVPSPVKRVEIPKPNGGIRRVGDSDGGGSGDSADAVAGTDADLRADVQ